MNPRLRAFWESIDFNPSYNLSRPYPFKAFKWIAVSLMTALFLFFTVFNIATVGYDLDPTTSMDPNGTESQRRWFNNVFFTWGNDNLDPTCQDIVIGNGFQFFTSNQGSIHTVNGISGPCSNDNRSQVVKCPSVTYRSQILSNCRVNSVSISLRKTDATKSGLGVQWWSWGYSYASAQAQCDIINSNGTYTIAFDAKFSGTTKDFTFVAIDDFNAFPSLWWGTRIMDNYFNGVQVVMATGLNASSTNQAVYTGGQLDYYTVNTSSIRGRAPFNASFYFYEPAGFILNPQTAGHPSDQLIFNNDSFDQSRSLTEGLFFAKAFYSLVLTDLGQTSSANLLLDDQSLQYALNPDDDFNRQPDGPLYGKDGWFDWWRSRGITPNDTTPAESNSILMSDAYTALPKTTLGTRPATMYLQYTCSVPKRKGTSTILLLVLVADFVLLQTAWTILKFFANGYIAATDPKAMYCDGCSKPHRQSDEVALMALPPSRPASTAGVSSGMLAGKYQSLHDEEPDDPAHEMIPEPTSAKTI